MPTRTINPYIAGNPIKDRESFVGRDNIFRDVMQMLHHPKENAIVLFGQRRIGKTTVLLQLAQRLSAEGRLTPVYFDLQDKASSPLVSVLYDLAQNIAAKIGQPTPDRNLFDTEGRYFRETFLPAAAAQAGPDGLVLLLDEFDVLDTKLQSQAGQSFFPYLRAWMADIQRVKFVFVIGRRPEELSIETLSTFKGIRATRVSLMGWAEVEAIVWQSERNGTLAWSAEAVESIWEWTHGHSYFTQLLCSIVWEDIHEAAGRPRPLQATPEDVEGAVPQALRQGANAFYWIWDGLPPAERVVIAAMAEASDSVISQDAIEEILNRSGVRLVVRELKLAPDVLIDWELLYRVGDPGSQAFQFAVPLLRRWVKVNRPLSRVKEELDRLDPLAESLFHTGESFYGLGQIDEAERQIRQAIRINPNHLKSRLLLARILLESGTEARVKEAVEVLEEAYKYDPGSTLPDFIKTLLALANLQSDDNQKLAVYERILQMQPSQPAAESGRRAILKARAEQALTGNQLDEALDAFQSIGDVTGILRVQQVQAQALIDKQLQLARDYESRNQWTEAISIYRALAGQYPTNQTLTDRLQVARSKLKAIQLESALEFEAREDWERAQIIYKNMLDEYPDDPEVAARLQAVLGLSDLVRFYQDALKAIEARENAKAKRLLGQVLAKNPDYKDAAARLHGLVNPAAKTVPSTPKLVRQSWFGHYLLSILVSALLWIGLFIPIAALEYNYQHPIMEALVGSACSCYIYPEISAYWGLLPILIIGVVIWFVWPAYYSKRKPAGGRLFVTLAGAAVSLIVFYAVAVFLLTLLPYFSSGNFSNSSDLERLISFVAAGLSAGIGLIPTLCAAGTLGWLRTLIIGAKGNV